MNKCPVCESHHLRRKNKKEASFKGKAKDGNLSITHTKSTGYYCKCCHYDSDVYIEPVEKAPPKKKLFGWLRK